MDWAKRPALWVPGQDWGILFVDNLKFSDPKKNKKRREKKNQLSRVLVPACRCFFGYRGGARCPLLALCRCVREISQSIPPFGVQSTEYGVPN
jgi:hypothetical protein